MIAILLIIIGLFTFLHFANSGGRFETFADNLVMPAVISAANLLVVIVLNLLYEVPCSSEHIRYLFFIFCGITLLSAIIAAITDEHPESIKPAIILCNVIMAIYAVTANLEGVMHFSPLFILLFVVISVWTTKEVLFWC